MRNNDRIGAAMLSAPLAATMLAVVSIGLMLVIYFYMGVPASAIATDMSAIYIPDRIHSIRDPAPSLSPGRFRRVLTTTHLAFGGFFVEPNVVVVREGRRVFVYTSPTARVALERSHTPMSAQHVRYYRQERFEPWENRR